MPDIADAAPPSFRTEEHGVFTKFICKVCERLKKNPFDTLYVAAARDHARWAHLDKTNTVPTVAPAVPLPAEDAAQVQEQVVATPPTMLTDLPTGNAKVTEAPTTSTSESADTAAKKE